MKFKGRIGVGVITLLIIINIMGILDTLKSGDIKTLMLLCIIFFLVDLLIIDLTIRNYSYITSDGILVVRLGVFKQQIPCKDIKCIKKNKKSFGRNVTIIEAIGHKIYGRPNVYICKR